jgi:hypothetical protein
MYAYMLDSKLYHVRAHIEHACVQVFAHTRITTSHARPYDHLVEAGNDHLLSGGLPASASLGHGGGVAGDFARRHAAACEEAGAQLRYARTHDWRLQ